MATRAASGISVVCREKRDEPVAVFDARIEQKTSPATWSAREAAEIDAPTVTQITEARDLPSLIVDTVDHFGKLVALAAKLPPLKTAVVCPEDHNSLSGALALRPRTASSSRS